MQRTTITISKETSEKIKKFISKLHERLRIKLSINEILNIIFDEKNHDRLMLIVVEKIHDDIDKEKRRLLDKTPFIPRTLTQQEIPINSLEGQAILKWIEDIRKSD